MSCDAVALVATLWLASAAPMTATTTPAVAVSAPPSSVASEPLFLDIVKRADALKAAVDAWKGKDGPLDGFDMFKTQVAELSKLDMDAHLLLKARGTDGDLKCILRGISQDLPLKLEAVTAAATPKALELALRDMAYLLNDNVEVITTPPTVTSQSST